ncbi:MAG: hypothetical protein ACFCU2_11995 [Acidimicrobiia bacterium]
MLRTIAHVLLAVELGAGFGAASAELVSTTSNAIQVDLRVEVTQSAETVIAHLVAEGEAPLALPLLQREPGIFGIRTELKAINYRVVFELFGPDPARSEPTSLMELGVGFSGGGPDTTITTNPEDLPEDVTRWLWLAIAFGAASLSALAFWVLGGDDRQVSSTDGSTESAEGDV